MVPPPVINATITAPDMLSSGVRFERIHQQVLKEIVREELEHHHKVRMPRHFQATNRMRYKHFPRSPGYKSYKMRVFHSRTDLVKGGGTSQKFRGRYDRLRVGGDIKKGKIVGTLTYRFPFPVGRKSSKPTSVTVHKMAFELENFASDEIADIQKSVGRKYAQKIKQAMAAQKTKLVVRPRKVSWGHLV